MSVKRNPETDISRRIYASTIDRINKHLEARPKDLCKRSKKPRVKNDFNKFLVSLLDVYEEVQKAPVIYVYDGIAYSDAAEARGIAIETSVRKKKRVKWPDVYVYVGEDEI